MSRKTPLLPHRGLLPAVLFIALAGGLMAQSTNDANASLVINSVDDVAPNTVAIVPPATVDIQIAGIPNSPYLLLHGATLTVGGTVFAPGLSLDVGPFAGIQVLQNGIAPSVFLDFFASTGTGNTSLTLVAPPNLPAGSLGALQAIVVDFTMAPPFVAFTAATELVVNQPCDYGTAFYSRGTSTVDSDSFIGDGATQTSTQVSFPSNNVDIESIALNNYEYLNSNVTSPGPIDRFRAPTAARPLADRSNSSFPCIHTIHGDLYVFEDASVSPSEFGYMLVPAGALPPAEIPGSRMNNVTSAASPWETEIAISNDSSMMAAVYDPTGGLPDQIFLMRLDGTLFSANGASVIEVTPVGANATIDEESMKFTSTTFYFTDGGGAGALYEVPIDPFAVATPVTMPLLGTGNAVTQVDGESIQSEALGDIYVLGGASGTERDIFRIDGATGLISNVTNFPTPTEVDLFGDSYDSIDGRVGVSPSGFTIAFVVEVTNGLDDLFVASPFGAFPVTQVTGDTDFDPSLDTVVDINVINDDEVLYFLGTTTGALDLFHYRISTGAHTNVTGTSGSTTIPFGGVPTMDADGYFNFNGRMIFARDGITSFGPSAGTSVLNFISVDHATLTVTNITGDEFGGATGPNIDAAAPNATGIAFAPNADQIWFHASLATSLDEEFFVFDPNVVGIATQVTNNGTASDLRYDNMVIDDLGTAVLASVRLGSSGDEEVAMVTNTGSNVILTNDLDPLSDIGDGTIRFLDPAAPCNGFIYSQGTNSSSNPSDATLKTYDLINNATTVIDSTPGVYWIYSLGM